MSDGGLPFIPEESAGASVSRKRRRASGGTASSSAVARSSSAIVPVASSAAAPDQGLPHGLPAVLEESDNSALVQHVHRGSHKDGEGAVPAALQEVLRNLQRVLAQTLDVEHAKRFLGSRRPRRPVRLSTLLDKMLPRQQWKTHHLSRAEDVMSALTGMSAYTIQTVLRRVKSRHGRAEPCKGAGGRPSHRGPSGVDPKQDDESHSSQFGEGEDELREGVELDEPSFAEPVVQALGLDLQRGHDLRQVGWRLGALVARIFVDPRLPISAFTPFVAYMDAQAPGCVGELNHGFDFFSALSRCMVSHLQLCMALEHWAKVPALGIPSDFARIIDGYTSEGEPCQIVVHVITRPSGDLDWVLVDIAPIAGAVSGGEDRSRAHEASQIVQSPALFSTMLWWQLVLELDHLTSQEHT